MKEVDDIITVFEISFLYSFDLFTDTA